MTESPKLNGNYIQHVNHLEDLLKTAEDMILQQNQELKEIISFVEATKEDQQKISTHKNDSVIIESIKTKLIDISQASIQSFDNSHNLISDINTISVLVDNLYNKLIVEKKEVSGDIIENEVISSNMIINMNAIKITSSSSPKFVLINPINCKSSPPTITTTPTSNNIRNDVENKDYNVINIEGSISSNDSRMFKCKYVNSPECNLKLNNNNNNNYNSTHSSNNDLKQLLLDEDISYEDLLFQLIETKMQLATTTDELLKQKLKNKNKIIKKTN